MGFRLRIADMCLQDVPQQGLVEVLDGLFAEPPVEKFRSRSGDRIEKKLIHADYRCQGSGRFQRMPGEVCLFMLLPGSRQ